MEAHGSWSCPKPLELWHWKRSGKFSSINRYFFLFLGNFLMSGARMWWSIEGGMCTAVLMALHLGLAYTLDGSSS